MWRGFTEYIGMNFTRATICPLHLEELRQVMREWEYICNFLRPKTLRRKKLREYLIENYKKAISFDAKLF